MEIIRGEHTSEAVGDFGSLGGIVHSELEGRKVWKSPIRLQFLSSEHNFRVFLDNFPELDPEPEKERNFTTINVDDYPFRLVPRDYQLACFEKFKDLKGWAMFSEPGTGKTKNAWDILSYNFMFTQRITGAMILSYPKGVHAQWVEDQMPKHLWEGITPQAAFWNGKKPPHWLGKVGNQPQVFSGNIEMLAHKRSREVLEEFAESHKGKFAFLIDESDCIKNKESVRNKEARYIADTYKATIRGIMTGTPIAKNLIDEWAQFFFVDKSIIGHEYMVSFRSQYCRMGGHDDKQVVGHRNLLQFKKMVAPYTFRATKAELNLPDKIMDEVVFDLTDEQRGMIADIKETFLTEINNSNVSAKTGAVALLRMQQISCGFVKDEEGNIHWLKENPRLKSLMHMRETLGANKRLIWCRFVDDIERIVETIGPGAYKFYGASKDHERKTALHEFMYGEATDLVANPAALGRGVDGLQKVCSYSLYYSNSFNAIERWQSEDRIHRIDMLDTSPTYLDFIGRGSPDRGILRNLRLKKSLADMALDDYKEIIQEIDT